MAFATWNCEMSVMKSRAKGKTRGRHAEKRGAKMERRKSRKERV
ncbi:uncharacterized protein G2W53_002786 [Senna tora]|uniref:Uncharacterized protein n=1 Tax=Senna tora TaxID=362788 RepID=A0A834X7W1_9FABA|nr:uncharacterized protein G2W53_002786 [Senna tora]